MVNWLSSQAIVKKAVVDSMKKTYKTTWFQETGALYRIEVALHKDVATLTLDASGIGLHKRGYRSLHNQAPLKETMAAAMVIIGLENRLNAKVGLLSGGERQALSLLMATFTEPKILLLDEHTAALDPARAELYRFTTYRSSIGEAICKE